MTIRVPWENIQTRITNDLCLHVKMIVQKKWLYGYLRVNKNWLEQSQISTRPKLHQYSTSKN